MFAFQPKLSNNFVRNFQSNQQISYNFLIKLQFLFPCTSYTSMHFSIKLVCIKFTMFHHCQNFSPIYQSISAQRIVKFNNISKFNIFPHCIASRIKHADIGIYLNLSLSVSLYDDENTTHERKREWVQAKFSIQSLLCNFCVFKTISPLQYTTASTQSDKWKYMWVSFSCLELHYKLSSLCACMNVRMGVYVSH